jgi:hypothetical protein
MALDAVAYVSSFHYLVRYLRRFHFTTWAELGQPELSVHAYTDNPPRFGALRIFGFIFSDRYKRLNDNRLRALIWLIRILFLGLILFFIFLIVPRTGTFKRLTF